MAVQEASDQVLHFFVHLSLCAFLREDLVEKEEMLWTLSSSCLGSASLIHFYFDLLRVRNDKLALDKIKRIPGARISLEVVWQDRPSPNEHSDVPFVLEVAVKKFFLICRVDDIDPVDDLLLLLIED